MADHYATLGVARDASPDEIKRAYRRLARESHPDANPGDPDAEARFKEISAAYEVLGDTEKRQRYDTYGDAAGGLGGDDAGFGGGFGTIFDAFFGGGSFSGTGPSGRARGNDIEVMADLDFEDAVFGCRQEIAVRIPVPCHECEATGAAAGTTPEMCAQCGGAGQVRRVRQSLLGQVVTAGACPACGGLGEIVSAPCPTCHGEGRVTDERTYTLDIPAGVDTGSTLRLSGKGAVGPRGGGYGDLFVHVRVRPHARFVRRGVDLVHELHITMAQAALGVDLEFETLDGSEDLVIPGGTQAGRVFRLRGRGVPHVERRGRGDLLVEVVVETPTDLTGEQERLLRVFADDRGEVVGPEGQGLLGRIRSAFS